MTYRMALPMLTLVALGGCDGSSVMKPMSEELSPASLAEAPSSVRSGAVNIEKECSTFTGSQGDICTITSSNVREIPVGSTITYASAAVDGLLDTDITLDPPGPGNNQAFGHCTLPLATGVGKCTLSGGTGRFQWFNATVDVSPLGWPDFAWNGEYSYGK